MQSNPFRRIVCPQVFAPKCPQAHEKSSSIQQLAIRATARNGQNMPTDRKLKADAVRLGAPVQCRRAFGLGRPQGARGPPMHYLDKPPRPSPGQQGRSGFHRRHAPKWVRIQSALTTVSIRSRGGSNARILFDRPMASAGRRGGMFRKPGLDSHCRFLR
jgi:hypothetical protein